MLRTSIITAILIACVMPAHAIDFTAPLLNEDGKPYEKCAKFEPAKQDQPGAQPICKETVSITLGQFVFDALNVPEQGLTNEGIVSRGLLAIKVKSAKDMELTDVQRDVAKAALLNSLKNGNFPVAIVQALKIIDPAAVKDK